MMYREEKFDIHRTNMLKSRRQNKKTMPPENACNSKSWNVRELERRYVGLWQALAELVVEHDALKQMVAGNDSGKSLVQPRIRRH